MSLFNEPALFFTSFSLYPPLLLTNGQCRRYRCLMGELQVCSALLGRGMVPLPLRWGMVLLARNGHWDAIGHCVSFDCCVLAAVSDAYNCAHKGLIINYIIFKGISPLICCCLCCLWLLFLCPPPVPFCPPSLPVSSFFAFVLLMSSFVLLLCLCPPSNQGERMEICLRSFPPTKMLPPSTRRGTSRHCTGAELVLGGGQYFLEHLYLRVRSQNLYLEVFRHCQAGRYKPAMAHMQWEDMEVCRAQFGGWNQRVTSVTHLAGSNTQIWEHWRMEISMNVAL